MKIVFVPVAPGQVGCTSTVLLISLFFAARYNQDVGYFPITTDMQTIYDYLGLEPTDDSSRKVAVLGKIIANGANNSVMTEYSVTPTKNFHIFDLNDVAIPKQELMDLHTRIINASEYHHTLVEVDYNTPDEIKENLIANADVVLFISNASVYNLSQVEGLRADVPTTSHCIVNNYHSIVMPQTKIQKGKYFKSHKDVVFLHFNPYIQQFANIGDFLKLVDKINDRQAQVAELEADLCTICDLINIHNGEPNSGKLRRIIKVPTVQKPKKVSWFGG